jgi:hypothetical protein
MSGAGDGICPTLYFANELPIQTTEEFAWLDARGRERPWSQSFHAVVMHAN